MASRKSVRAALATVIVAFLAATLSFSGAGVEPTQQDDGVAAVIARYQTTIPEQMAEEHVPGLALAVVDGDGVVWQQGFGRTDDHGGTAVNVDTIFSVQSMSKVFTATAIMQATKAGSATARSTATSY